ncbi:hypothetical protein [Candidatus Tisiphia endosymbiont of Sialis lutaria]|uniref:hypothetical protein n=1 Tax=Candidatus Tisiphia endosymbiont of Sialis lutaria TaxID=2029164 RepID=UPI00312C9254
MSYFLQPKRVKYRITLVIVGSLLEVTTSPTSPELTINNQEGTYSVNDYFSQEPIKSPSYNYLYHIFKI